jgi:collagen type III alpha
MRARRVIAIFAALLTSGTAVAGTPAWTISESSGSVTVVTRGISKIATRGGSLSAGDLVSTSTNGRAVLVRGQEYLVVSPGSRIRIADPVASGGFTQIIQDFGNAVFRIKKKSTPHFAVETPYLAAVVKGTTFSVTVTDTGTAVQVTEGLVQVSTNDGGASHLVRPGDIGLVESANPLRLSIKGRDAQVIDSPNPPASKAAPATTIAAAATQAFAEVKPSPVETKAAESGAAANMTPKAEMPMSFEASASNEKASMFDTVIGAPVTEGMVNLDTMSGGMVQGNSMMMAEELATVEAIVPRPAPVESLPTATVSIITTPALDITADLIKESPSAPAVEAQPPVSSGTTEVVIAPTPAQIAVVEPEIMPLPPVAGGPSPATNPQPSTSGRVEVPVIVSTTTPITPVEVAAILVEPSAPTTPSMPNNGQSANNPGSSCAGVPNCNGATYVGPSNVPNGSSCAGVANCNGGIFNVNGNAGGNSPAPIVDDPDVGMTSSKGQGQNGNGNGNGQNGSGNGQNGNGNANGQNGSGNGQNGNGNGNGQNGSGNGQNGNGNGQNGSGNGPNGNTPIPVP